MNGHPVRLITPDQLNGAGEVGPFPIEQFERRCLAQGDSWFSIGAIPPFLTTNLLLELDELERGTCIVNCAAPGATLKRMVDTVRSTVFRRLMTTERWDAILLSGSGNDLIAALGADDPDPARRLLARQDEWGDAPAGGGRYLSPSGWLTFTDHIRAMFDELVALRASGPSQHAAIVLHTYDIAVPRDSPAGPGFGPWLSKALQHFQVPAADWASVAEVLFSRLRVLLKGISESDPSLVLVETMGVLQKASATDHEASGDWQNEIHPTRAGYKKLAQRWEGVLNEVLDGRYSPSIATRIDAFRATLEQRSFNAGPLMDEVQPLHVQAQPVEEAAWMNFADEGTGQKPIPDVSASTPALQEAATKRALQLRQLLRDERVAQTLEETQERQVDARLELLRPDGEVHALRSSHGIPAGARVRLWAHIGQRSAESLLAEEPPALDPLLPDLDDGHSHELDIVLFPKDFRLAADDSPVRMVRLPRFGGTPAVSWTLEVPTEGDRAELRFSVYFRNQLLQSFTLQATLQPPSGAEGAEGSCVIRCDFSQTRRFGRLEERGDRIASFALNDSERGSHLLAVRGSGLKAGSVEWEDAFLATQVDALREALFAALVPDGHSPFGFLPDTLQVAPGPAASFDASATGMARAGSALFNQMVLKADEDVRELLSTIQASDDQTVQVSAISQSYTLPWGLIYDYELPDSMPAVPAPVCRGFNAAGLRCACGAGGAERVCMRGFWGFRHYLEQLTGRQSDTDERSICAAPTHPVLGFVSPLHDTFVETLIEELRKTPAGTVQQYDPPPPLMDVLRDPAQRPSLFVFVGHQGIEGSPKQPLPRLLGAEGTALLQLSHISRELLAKRAWKQPPRSLVLLLGCGTGVQRVDTGIALAGAMLELGASGVLASECTVFTGVVARFARDLTQRLLQHAPVKEALRDVVHGLAREGCPCGLAFTYLGPLDLRLP